MAVGLGGATISDILFFRFLKDYRITKKEVEVLNVLKNIIVTTMFFIVFSGLFLYLPQAEKLNASAMFRVKTIATFVLVANGVALHIFIAPYLIRLNFMKKQAMSHAWSCLAFALGSISICSWYTAFLIAMLKTVLPFTFHEMVSAYFLLLLSAISVSQLMRIAYKKKAKQMTA